MAKLTQQFKGLKNNSSQNTQNNMGIEQNYSLNLEDLYKIIDAKISHSNIESYTTKLAHGDIAKLVQKIGEEGVEVTIAGLIHDKDNSDKSRNDLINEVCDLFYHSLVLLARNKINLNEIYSELYNRNNKNK